MKPAKNLAKNFGFISIGLCAICCALPLIGMTLSVTTLTVLSNYFEWAGIVALALTLIFFGIYFFNERKAPACDIDCACKSEKENSKGDV